MEPLSVEEIGTHLATVFVHGEKAHVLDELLTYRPVIALAVAAQVMEFLTIPDRQRFVKILTYSANRQFSDATH